MKHIDRRVSFLLPLIDCIRWLFKFLPELNNKIKNDNLENKRKEKGWDELKD